MDNPQKRTECTGICNAMKLVRRTAVWAACLVFTGGALADNHNTGYTGWYFSRANCWTANESITWKIDATPSALEALVGQVIPGAGFSGLGIPAYRRTTSSHQHRYEPSKGHHHQSAPALVWTWRAHAGSFPVPEAFPYFSVRIGSRLVWAWGGDGLFTINLVPYIQIIMDTEPWSVTGEHYERTSLGADLVIRSSYATGCNWLDTFNSM